VFSNVTYAADENVRMTLNYDGKAHQYNEKKVVLKINGQELSNLTMPPIILDNYTVVPAREVFEAVGAKVDWDKNTYKVIVNYADKKVVLKIGDINASVNGVSQKMSIPAKIINNKTMIPLRFVSESVGIDVSWEPSSRVISINNKNISDKEEAKNVLNSSEESPSVELNEITSVSVPTDSNDGKFTINASKKISKTEVVFLTDNRLVIDIYDTKIKMMLNTIDVSNFAVLRVRVGQNDSVARVVFDLKKDYKYTVTTSEDKKSIIVTFQNNQENDANNTVNAEPKNDAAVNIDPKNDNNTKNNASVNSTTSKTTFKPSNNLIKSNVNGIYYDRIYTTLVINKNGGQVDLNNSYHTDGYNMGVYKIVLKGNYSKFLKSALMNVNDHNFSSIKIDVNTTSTTINFNEKTILAFNISQDAQNIYISAVQPKVKYKNIVVLDAGHGAHDSGATSGNYVEKSINLDIVNRVLSLLEKDGNIKGYATRTSDSYPSFTRRNQMGNQLGDMFISVHINSASAEKANGTEVYYHDTKNVTLSRGISSSLLASTLQKNLLSYLKSTDRKVKRENFIVLRQSNVPAALCEIGFITNTTEGAKLNSPEYRQLAAQAIYQSIKELFQKYPNR